MIRPETRTDPAASAAGGVRPRPEDRPWREGVQGLNFCRLVVMGRSVTGRVVRSLEEERKGCLGPCVADQEVKVPPPELGPQGEGWGDAGLAVGQQREQVDEPRAG